MPTASNFTCIVNVLWQAAPEPLSFHQLSAADQDTINQKFVGQINSLISEGDQAKWQNLVVTAVDYDEVATKVNSLLKAEVTPPAGTELVLPQAAVVWIPLSQNGHAIMFSAMLKDSSATTLRDWTLSASQGGVIYTARIVLSYEVVVARLP